MSNLSRHLPSWQQWAGKHLGWLFMKDIPEGAATTCQVATSPDFVGVRGYYFSDSNVDEGETTYMYADAMAKELWRGSQQITRDYLPAPPRNARQCNAMQCKEVNAWRPHWSLYVSWTKLRNTPAIINA